ARTRTREQGNKTHPPPAVSPWQLRPTHDPRAGPRQWRSTTPLAAAACSDAGRPQRPVPPPGGVPPGFGATRLRPPPGAVPPRGGSPAGLAATGLPSPTALRRAAAAGTARSTTAPTKPALT